MTDEKKGTMKRPDEPKKDPFAIWADLFNLDDEYLKYILVFYKVLAFPAIIVAALICYDIVAPATISDQAIVQDKQERRLEGVKYYLRARGERFGHFEEVSRDFYKRVQPGDNIVIRLSPIFLEAKSITLAENGRTRAETGGGEAIAMAIFALAGFLTLLPFFKGISFFSRANTLIIVLCPIVGLASIAVLLKLMLAFFGVIDRV